MKRENDNIIRYHNKKDSLVQSQQDIDNQMEHLSKHEQELLEQLKNTLKKKDRLT